MKPMTHIYQYFTILLSHSREHSREHSYMQMSHYETFYY